MLSRRRVIGSIVSVQALSVVPSPVLALENEYEIKLKDAFFSIGNEDGQKCGFLSVNWDFKLPAVFLTSLQRGIPFYFKYEFTLSKNRWYWLDKSICTSELSVKVSYSPLTRQYRLSSGGLTQSFSSAESITALLSHRRHWKVIDFDGFSPQDLENMHAAVRMRLDLSMLPRPLQVSISGDSIWEFESTWCPIDLLHLKPEN